MSISEKIELFLLGYGKSRKEAQMMTDGIMSTIRTSIDVGLEDAYNRGVERGLSGD